MSWIAIRKSTSKLSVLTFDSGIEDSEQKIYNNIAPRKTYINRSVEEGILLNGRQYQHTLYRHREWDLIISANEIDQSDINFLDDFNNSLFKYISLYNGSDWSDYIEVLTTDGRLSIEYIEGLEDLPEVSLNLREVNKYA